MITEIPKGFRTHTKDIMGDFICLGDVVDYDFEGDEPCPFEVIFEENSFRKKYFNHSPDEFIEGYPLLENSFGAEKLRMKIIKKYND